MASHTLRTAVPSTSHGGSSGAAFATGSVPVGLFQVAEGKYTHTVYALIQEERYADVVKILNNELQTRPKSRAALSLLGFCYFQQQDFSNAANWWVVSSREAVVQTD
jgi:hypothetical protein